MEGAALLGLFWGLRASNVFEPLLAGLVVLAGALLVSRSASRDLAVRRRLESTERFTNLVATAHGRPADGRDRSGVSEQVAAVLLIGEFGKENPWLTLSARRALESMAWLGRATPSLRSAIEEALVLVDGDPDSLNINADAAPVWLHSLIGFAADTIQARTSAVDPALLARVVATVAATPNASDASTWAEAVRAAVEDELS